MKTGILYPLTPEPVAIETGILSGKLLIDGNITENLLLFRFLFDTAASMSPLFIQVEVLHEVYQYFCGIRDFSNPVMKTAVIRPEFDIKNKIRILKIEPLVSSAI